MSISLIDKVKTIIEEHLGVELDEITSDASFSDDLGADSTDMREMVMAFEEKFEIEIPEEDSENIVSVEDMVSYIKSHGNYEW
ncbi:MAG: acyl carrier protein [Chitinophagales bacterium]